MARAGKATRHVISREILAGNTRTLMDRRSWNQTKLATKAQVSQRHISNILGKKVDATIAMTDALGAAFGIPGWLLLVPNLPDDLLDSPELPAMVERYAAHATARK
jgi:transcriptional regulator with XRE-family HTH domain